ncbi:MAG: hypothetical protein PHW79_09770 [Candidatus Marinimicrobia bacterium]|jgi:hypothetical protein|nr:hypothetical protein [Candidatus Neomarinimicrobiota bacterium]
MRRKLWALIPLVFGVHLLSAQSIGFNVGGGWTQMKSKQTFDIRYNNYHVSGDNQTFNRFIESGLALDFGLRYTIKSGRLAFLSGFTFNRLDGHTDSLRIFPPPYS